MYYRAVETQTYNMFLSHVEQLPTLVLQTAFKETNLYSGSHIYVKKLKLNTLIFDNNR